MLQLFLLLYQLFRFVELQICVSYKSAYWNTQVSWTVIDVTNHIDIKGNGKKGSRNSSDSRVLFKGEV